MVSAARRQIRKHNREKGSRYDSEDMESFLREHDISLPGEHLLYLHHSNRGKVDVLAGMYVNRLTTRTRIIAASGPGTWVAQPQLMGQEVGLLADV